MKQIPGGEKLWNEVAILAKSALFRANGNVGLLFIEKNEATAAIVLGADDDLKQDHLVKALRMFRVRLDDMIKHAESGTFDATDGDKTYIRDNVTGEYEEGGVRTLRLTAEQGWVDTQPLLLPRKQQV